MSHGMAPHIFDVRCSVS